MYPTSNLVMCHSRQDETHSEGQDTDGGEHVQIFRFGIVRISSSQVVYLHTIGPKVQEVQLLANTQVR